MTFSETTDQLEHDDSQTRAVAHLSELISRKQTVRDEHIKELIKPDLDNGILREFVTATKWMTAAGFDQLVRSAHIEQQLGRRPKNPTELVVLSLKESNCRSATTAPLAGWVAV